MTSGYEAPWPAADTSWLVEQFWPRLEKIANDPEHQLNGEVVFRLRLILMATPALPDDSCEAPLVLVYRDGALSWGVSSPKRGDRDTVEQQIRFALMLLWHPDVRGRLGTCRKCGRFFLRSLGRGRRREFCTDDHRKSFHAAAAAPSRAAYQRTWRNPHRASTATK